MTPRLKWLPKRIKGNHYLKNPRLVLTLKQAVVILLFRYRRKVSDSLHTNTLMIMCCSLHIILTLPEDFNHLARRIARQTASPSKQRLFALSLKPRSSQDTTTRRLQSFRMRLIAFTTRKLLPRSTPRSSYYFSACSLTAGILLSFQIWLKQHPSPSPMDRLL
jgi:hypothetical protein